MASGRQRARVEADLVASGRQRARVAGDAELPRRQRTLRSGAIGPPQDPSVLYTISVWGNFIGTMLFWDMVEVHAYWVPKRGVPRCQRARVEADLLGPQMPTSRASRLLDFDPTPLP